MSHVPSALGRNMCTIKVKVIQNRVRILRVKANALRLGLHACCVRAAGTQ